MGFTTEEYLNLVPLLGNLIPISNVPLELAHFNLDTGSLLFLHPNAPSGAAADCLGSISGGRGLRPFQRRIPLAGRLPAERQ